MHEYEKLTYVLAQLDRILQVLQVRKQKSAVCSAEQKMTKLDSSKVLNKIVSKVNRIVERIQSDGVGRNKEEVRGNENEDYQQIQKQLQKQERINRQLIKKQLEYKQYQQALFDQFSSLKTAHISLKSQKKQLQELLYSKQFQAQGIQNQKKMILRDKKIKESLTFQTFLNGKIGHVDMSFKQSVHKRKLSEEPGRLSANRKKANYSAVKK